jgi:hypothetical protein
MNCKGVIGRLLGHDYQPRYSFSFQPGVTFSLNSYEGSREDYEAMLNSWKDRTYHRDVCRRCGRIIKEPA